MDEHRPRWRSRFILLVLSTPGDGHADAVAAILSRRAVPFVRWDQTGFADRDGLTVEFTAAGRRGPVLRLNDACLALDDVETVYMRRFAHVVVTRPAHDAAARAYVASEATTAINAVLGLPMVRWVPGTLSAVRDAGDKVRQLQVAQALGLEIPPTLITSEPTALWDFYREHDARVIIKPLSFPWFETEGKRWVPMPQLVTPRDLVHAEGLRQGAAILQAYVPKQLELRVTVVGDRLFACEIHSQATNRTRVDWRRYNLNRTPHRVHTLPDDVSRQCVAIVARLGLSYGALDLVLTPEGRYVFLEVNPMGQYLWIEKLTGLPISEAICDLLTLPAAHASGSRNG